MSDFAKVILDSEHFNGGRLTTMVLKVPTCVLAQFNTHRWFSRNAASQRAIPTAKVLASVKADPYIPEFLENQKGMQGGAPVRRQRLARAVWLFAMHLACFFATGLARLGCHKQVVNRLVSPWSYTKVVTTGTDEAWANFLALRADPHADPAIARVAYAAAQALVDSRPQRLTLGEWHLPYADSKLAGGRSKDNITASVARCARVSYSTFDQPDKPSTIEADRDLCEKLLGSDPKHASPSEHQACAVIGGEQGGNFGVGWMQYRKTLMGEVRSDLSAELRRLGY